MLQDLHEWINVAVKGRSRGSLKSPKKNSGLWDSFSKCPRLDASVSPFRSCFLGIRSDNGYVECVNEDEDKQRLWIL